MGTQQINEIQAKQVSTSTVQVHDKLNDKFWKGDKLIPSVRKALLKVAHEYVVYLGLPKNVKIKDIVFTGSLSNYNYTALSDVDVHIMLDYSQVAKDKDFAMKYFLSKKDSWSADYKITIKGYPVELFAQDLGQKTDFTSRYSLLNDKWVNKPEPLDKRIDLTKIKDGVAKWGTQIDDFCKTIKSGKYSYPALSSKIAKFKEALRKERQDSLAKDGEFGEGNLVYKVLRNLKYLEKLSTAEKELTHDEFTLNEQRLIKKYNILLD